MSYLKCYDTLGEELKYLYQWDINPNVIIKEIELDNDIEVHVCHVDSVNALTVIPSVTDGNIVVSVPSVLLQRAAPIMIYFVRKISEESACTIMVSKITVIPRARPSDYVYTEPEVLTWRILDERLKKIEDGASMEISPEVVEKAITEYLDENPPAQGVPGKTPVKGIDYFTPEEVHDIAEQAAGLVEIPESGGIEVTGAEVGQTIVVKAVDEKGIPTEWEPAVNGVPGFKLLVNTTLTDEQSGVQTLTFNKDKDGNPISCSRFVACITAKTTGESGNGYFNVRDQHWCGYCQSDNIPAASTRYVELFGGVAVQGCSRTASTTGGLATATQKWLSLWWNEKVYPNKITSINLEFQWNSNGIYWGSGSQIKIWGA